MSPLEREVLYQLNKAESKLESGKYKEAYYTVNSVEIVVDGLQNDDLLCKFLLIKSGSLYFLGMLDHSLEVTSFAIETYRTLIERTPLNTPLNKSYNSYIASAYNNMGTLLTKMGRYEEAKTCYEEALIIRRQLFKSERRNVKYKSDLAMTLNDRGILLTNIEHYEEAKTCYEEALKKRKELLKNDKNNTKYLADTSMTLNNLGILLTNMKRYEEAKLRYEESLNIYKKLLEADPKNATYQTYTATTLNNLGNLLYKIGNIQDTKYRYEGALDIYKKLLEADPKNAMYQAYTATTLDSLGNLLYNLGDIEKAQEKYKAAIEVFGEPEQYITISGKSKSIIRLISWKYELAGKPNNLLNRMNFLRETFQLCKEYRGFFRNNRLKYERNLVIKIGLGAYIDFLMKKIRFEIDSKNKVVEYEKALHAVEKLSTIEDDNNVLKLYSSAACYLRGRIFVNEALNSRKLELQILKQAVEYFRSARETYDEANVCFCIYSGLLKILEYVETLKEVNITKLKKLVQKILKTLPDNTSSNIRVSFENIPRIFEEQDRIAREYLLNEFEENVGEIEYKVLENLLEHVHEKIRDYFEEPFSPNLLYENWKLRVLFDDPAKVKGKLTIKAGDRILFNRNLSKEEIRQNLIEINYLKIAYFPQGQEEISFTTPEQKKPVIRSIDYFESLGPDNRTRILQYDCCNDICIDDDLQIAAVQLKYHTYIENSVVKLTFDDAYHEKVMTILYNLKDKVDVVVFPEFSIPFEYLRDIKQYVEDTGTIVVAGSHYITEGQIKKCGELFSQEFGEEDLRKNISPVIIPISYEEKGTVISSSKIVHNEKLLGAREERELFFEKRMRPGKINHIFKLQDNLRLGLMICYEYLNTDLRHRLIRACDVILVPQTNPNPERFYETTKHDIRSPICSGNKAYIMANGIFTVEGNKEVLGGSTGIVRTLDKYSYEKQDEGIIKPINEILEQFVLIASIIKDFNPAIDTQQGQIPIKTKLIHIFEESEIIKDSESGGRRFIRVLKSIKRCEKREVFKRLLINEKNNELIKVFSPLMHEHIKDLNELTLDEMKEKCSYIMIS